MNCAAVERKLRSFFRRRARTKGIAAVYLFGSVASGRVWRESDVDVAVLFTKDPPRTLSGRHFGLGFDLQEVVGRSVDLVVLNFASADLVHQVLKTGKLLFEGDPVARVRFEVRKRSEYWDLKPSLDAYRSGLLKGRG